MIVGRRWHLRDRVFYAIFPAPDGQEKRDRSRAFLVIASQVRSQSEASLSSTAFKFSRKSHSTSRRGFSFFVPAGR